MMLEGNPSQWQVPMLSQGTPSWAPPTLPSTAGVSSAAQELARLQKGSSVHCTGHGVLGTTPCSSDE